jgi:predicted nucleic acid-binding protein
MPTVSNTSPILNLAIIDHLDLLRAQFAQVIIPPDV